MSHVEVGRTFYDDVSKIVSSSRDGCRALVGEKRKDAGIMEEYLSPLSLLI